RTTLLNTVVTLVFITGCGKTGYYMSGGNWVYTSSVVHDGTTRRMDVDKATFRVLDTKSYAVDKNHVFLAGKIVNEADPATFRVLGASIFSVDKDHVFFVGGK
ncbi:MAG: hypothetical protein FJ267_17820, partial [Planctomycetes bacterium]|nr:hypothetical protein [Planctomycetota bacterium]